MHKRLPFFLLLALFVLCQTNARAQVFIKPSGYKAIPLRVQSLQADVHIIGSFAVTDWQMMFQLEGTGFGGWHGEGAVCDFICARPRDAKVTAFAVQDPSITGRVVDKAIATPRVAFRAAKDDPLLKSGLHAGNSFRASIYPMPHWGEITVRGTWVQVLNSSANRATYHLPLISLKGATTRLATLNVRVAIRDSAFQKASSNYNLPQAIQNGEHVLGLRQKNYRILRDLTVTIARQPAPLQTALLIAPNAKKAGGHFALALIADRNLVNPTLAFPGLKTSDLTFSTDTVRAGETLVCSGWYEGATGPVAARLEADYYKRDLQITPVTNEVARALWAVQKINALSAGVNNATMQANRVQIIALSKENAVVSPYTTWLAVGESDLKIYQHALVSSQLDSLVREYWMHIGDGQEKSPRVAQLKKTVTQISRANGLEVEDELYMRVGSAYGYVLSQKYNDESARNGKMSKARIEKRIARLSSRMLHYVTEKTEQKATRSIDWASPLYGGELYELRTKIVGEYRKPHPDYSELQRWEHRFAQLYGSTYLDPRLSFWRAHAAAQELEAQTSAAEKGMDKQKLAELKNLRISNSRNAYFVNNIGDPPIYVSAPADARQVIAIMPDGTIKTLEYNAGQQRWEGNYDVPVSMQEGDYSIQAIIVNADRTRRRYAMQFRVDTSPPTARGEVLSAPTLAPAKEKPLHLEIRHGGDVARVTALLPWGEKVSLLPSTVQGNLFFGNVSTPRGFIGKAIKVKYMLIDRAHNRTTIEVESVSHHTP